MKWLTALLLLLFLARCTPPARQEAQSLSGKVVNIADGDTFTLLLPDNTTKKIRLHGVDAPERHQPFGSVSRQRLRELIFQKQVSVEEKDVDRYGRIVGIAFVDGLSVNEEMLRSGLVWHYTRYDDNPQWAQLQEEARRAKKGLWQDKNPVAPWEWRQEQRGQGKAA
ncbi:MAG TPA: thermonuclease family protein [Chitinophagaceae bacterium]